MRLARLSKRRSPFSPGGRHWTKPANRPLTSGAAETAGGSGRPSARDPAILATAKVVYWSMPEQKNHYLNLRDSANGQKVCNYVREIIVKNGKRRSWSTTDVRTLKSMARKKTPAGKIAKMLKRSEGATRQKAFSMGLSLDARV